MYTLMTYAQDCRCQHTVNGWHNHRIMKHSTYRRVDPSAGFRSLSDYFLGLLLSAGISFQLTRFLYFDVMSLIRHPPQSPGLNSEINYSTVYCGNCLKIAQSMMGLINMSFSTTLLDVCAGELHVAFPTNATIYVI